MDYDDSLGLPSTSDAIISEVVILVNVGIVKDDSYDIWMSLTIPMPQYCAQGSIRTSYIQYSGNNSYGYVEFTNTSGIIQLVRIFFNGIEYSLTENLDRFKKVEWRCFTRYV